MPSGFPSFGVIFRRDPISEFVIYGKLRTFCHHLLILYSSILIYQCLKTTHNLDVPAIARFRDDCGISQGLNLLNDLMYVCVSENCNVYVCIMYNWYSRLEAVTKWDDIIHPQSQFKVIIIIIIIIIFDL